MKFDYKDRNFSLDVDDYFQKYEDECFLSHTCFGRIRSVSFYLRNLDLEPWAMAYDSMNNIELLEKYSDAHVIDRRWREVGEE